MRDEFGRLDTLILNASGGLERDADPGYAMRINCYAPVHLLTRALPLICAGGRVVFVTSHQAHFHGINRYPPSTSRSRKVSEAARTLFGPCAQTSRSEGFR